MPGRKKKSKSEKRQERKERKERAAREKASKSLTDAANAVDDIFTVLPAFKAHKKLGLTAEYKTYATLSESERKWAFGLLEGYMKSHYESCEAVGWDAKKKQRELADQDSRFVVMYATAETEKEATKENLSVVDNGDAAGSAPRQPVGYAMWRFLLDDNGYGELIPVLYLWEIHISSDYRRKGLGRFLMTLSELAAWKMKMNKITMTVFTSNKASLDFFKTKLKYKPDETDPAECTPEEPHCGYTILSKTRA